MAVGTKEHHMTMGLSSQRKRLAQIKMYLFEHRRDPSKRTLDDMAHMLHLADDPAELLRLLTILSGAGKVTCQDGVYTLTEEALRTVILAVQAARHARSMAHPRRIRE
jgi:hypothetical protein